MKRIVFIIALLGVLSISPTAMADEARPPKPSEKDKCPVCGMFVYKYSDWVASAMTGDGAWLHFDGAKDFLKHYLANRSAIKAAYVTEYYSLTMIDAKGAFYVVGSKVYGPMGHELIPFASRKDAEEFIKDHGGRAILKFDEIDMKTIEGLK